MAAKVRSKVEIENGDDVAEQAGKEVTRLIVETQTFFKSGPDYPHGHIVISIGPDGRIHITVINDPDPWAPYENVDATL